MTSRANEIMNIMSIKKGKKAGYSDFTPAVQLALNQARKTCAESSAATAERMGGDDETLEGLTSMCVRNMAMVNPVLNSSYYVRKEILQWDCPL